MDDSDSTNVQKFVSFYVEQHNKHLPHSAFDGQTQDEMYFGTGAEILEQLGEARIAARKARLKINLAQRCRTREKPAA